MLATEIVFEEWSEDRSRHTVERRCTLDIDAPYILKKVSAVCIVTPIVMQQYFGDYNSNVINICLTESAQLKKRANINDPFNEC